jgi:hypothetical protein
MRRALPPCSLQEELLLWRDPKRSAIVLGASTVGFLVLQFAKVNVIQWSAYLVLVAVLGCFLWNNLASFTHRQVGCGSGTRPRGGRTTAKVGGRPCAVSHATPLRSRWTGLPAGRP